MSTTWTWTVFENNLFMLIDYLFRDVVNQTWRALTSERCTNVLNALSAVDARTASTFFDVILTTWTRPIGATEARVATGRVHTSSAVVTWRLWGTFIDVRFTLQTSPATLTDALETYDYINMPTYNVPSSCYCSAAILCGCGGWNHQY